MSALGDDWARQQSVEILHDLANNPGAGGIAAAGAGMGMGFAAGGAINTLAQQVFAPTTAQSPTQRTDDLPYDNTDRFEPQTAGNACPDCNTENPIGAKFCCGCGRKLANECPVCHAANPGNARFCSSCGTKLWSPEKRERLAWSMIFTVLTIF